MQEIILYAYMYLSERVMHFLIDIKNLTYGRVCLFNLLIFIY